MQNIWNLIKLDMITMNGGKNSLKMAMVVMSLIIVGFGFVFSPVFGLYCPLLMGGLFVPALFQNEIKYHSEKLHSLLPISRKDLVYARFLFVTALYTVLFLIFYLLMLLSQHLKINQMILGEDARMMDVIGIIAERSGGAFTELGLFNLLYFSAYTFGLVIGSGSLKKYFKDSEAFSNALSIRKAQKWEYTAAVIIMAILVFWGLVVTGIIPLGTIIMPIMLLFIQLAQAADGFLLAAVMVTIAVFTVIYNCIGTVLEYDEKEL